MKVEVVDGIEAVRIDHRLVPWENRPCDTCCFNEKHQKNDCVGDRRNIDRVCFSAVFMRPLDYATFRLTGALDET